MSRLGLQDVAAILRGLQNVVNATVKLQESQIKQVWNNSSLKEMAEDLRHTGGKTIMNTLNSGNVQTDITKQLTELMERASMVGEGVKAYVKYSGGVIPQPDTESFTTEAEINELNLYSTVYPQDSLSVSKFDSDAHKTHNDAKVNGPSEKVVNNASSVNLGTENLKQNDSSQAPGKAVKVEEVDRTKTPENDTKQKPLDKVESRVKTETADVAVPESAAKPSPNSTKKPGATWVKKRQTLSSSSRQRKVPSSRLGRLMSFGGLAAGLGVGAAAEFTRRTLGLKDKQPGAEGGSENTFLTPANAERIVNTLCKVRGIFIDNIVEVAKRELAWEVDYVREAACTKKFKELLKPYPDYIVPDVIEHICFLIMQLCLKELFEFRYMQTDPNWSNFFYNPETRKMALLDFGASREYSKEFMDKYIQVIRGAADEDRQKVLKLSKELGFFTGYESKIMEEAHVDAVMILGEVFRSQTPFDFGAQNTTREIQQLVPTMIKHRLCPPPEEIYSLHRKLSGVFLLCSKLQGSDSNDQEVFGNYL
ncbi:Putative aarf domain-containing protein kinase 4 [Gryllus bimaculatus]|nr:Putative aarf domain-containing protein kinase 4 [Gryllus bimaculatus]